NNVPSLQFFLRASPLNLSIFFLNFELSSSLLPAGLSFSVRRRVSVTVMSRLYISARPPVSNRRCRGRDTGSSSSSPCTLSPPVKFMFTRFFSTSALMSAPTVLSGPAVILSIMSSVSLTFTLSFIVSPSPPHILKGSRVCPRGVPQGPVLHRRPGLLCL